MTRDAPIVGIGHFAKKTVSADKYHSIHVMYAVLVRWYRPIVVYIICKYKSLLHGVCVF